MKSLLFNGAILWHPTEEETKLGKESRLVHGIVTIVAKNAEAAKTKLILKTPTEFVNSSVDQLEYLVKGF